MFKIFLRRFVFSVKPQNTGSPVSYSQWPLITMTIDLFLQAYTEL